MPIHLKDMENRVHENCGFTMRNPGLVMMPGHIVLPTPSFLEFAVYIICGGARGWGGACPCPEELKQAVHDIKNLNLEALTDKHAAPSLGVAPLAPSGAKPHRILTDEAFFAMFKDKFANWKPIPADMAKLPEPVRKYMTALMDKTDPDDKAMAYVAQVDENKKLQHQVMEMRQKMLVKDKEITALGDYVTEVETKLERCEQVVASGETKLGAALERAATAEAAHRQEQDAHIEVANQLAITIAELDSCQQTLGETAETLKLAEDLLKESEEARERQNARFRGSGSDAEASEAAAVEGDPAAEERPEDPATSE